MNAAIASNGTGAKIACPLVFQDAVDVGMSTDVMPRIKKECATCGKTVPQKDIEQGLSVKSVFTGNRWCAKCVRLSHKEK